jgi:hypothetical protein
MLDSGSANLPITAPSHSQPAIYAPGALRRSTDRQRASLESFVAKYPEYARLAPDVILQYAATYRDDKDHALEQELRDNGVLSGARVDYSRPAGDDWDVVRLSDDVFEGEIQL